MEISLIFISSGIIHPLNLKFLKVLGKKYMSLAPFENVDLKSLPK
jgi:hypothetical protein